MYITLNLIFFFFSFFSFLSFIGKPFDAQPMINNAVSNIISCLVFGDRFEYNDKQFESILRDLNELVHVQGSAWAEVSLFCKGDTFYTLNIVSCHRKTVKVSQNNTKETHKCRTLVVIFLLGHVKRGLLKEMCRCM